MHTLSLHDALPISSPSANDQSEELQDSNNDSEGVESSQEDEVDKESEN